MKIVRLDKDSTPVFEFRKMVLFENSAPPHLVSEPGSYSNIVHKLGCSEDAYKFSAGKWAATTFDTLLGMEVEGSIVSVCGFKSYFEDAYLRIGMHYYTLSPFRKACMSALWHENGYLAYLSPEFHKFRGLFLSVAPHNSKLKAMVRSMETARRGQMGNATRNLRYLYEFQAVPGQYVFNSVAQRFFFYSKNSGEFRIFQAKLSEMSVQAESVPNASFVAKDPASIGLKP